MPYAIIRTGGKQYRATPGDLLRVELVDGDVGATVEFPDVLLSATDERIQVGTPLLEGVKVTATIVEQGRAKKVLIFKKKRRKNYRRRRGHRQSVTTVRITAIA